MARNAFEDVGFDELGGYDEVGAGSGRVRRRGYEDGEWLGVMGFTTGTNIAAAAPVEYKIKPTCNFRLRQIVIDRVQAAALQIGEIKIGQTTVFASDSTNPAPGDLFAPDSLCNPVFRNLPRVTPQVGFSIWVGASTLTNGAKIGFIGLCSQAD